ncbi:substrate-binding domain-containing protein, partial [Rosenbergiella nectarea]|uniref:substrate-binding domain-containing protein n=2 Tax=Rosenbergiella TaxID=1356488 RepID=UPI001F4FCD86
GFEHAWRDAGKSLDQVTQLHMPKGDEGYLAFASVLATHITPPSFAYDVVVCGNDRAAFVAYQQLLTMGIKIPHEMAVIGFDNLVGVGHLFLP